MAEVRAAGDIGRLIRDARRRSGVRQEDLALAANVSVKFISDLERGKETAPFRLVLEVVQMLGGRLDVSFPVAKPDDREELELSPLEVVRWSPLES
jgi:HTH-type transcriptional regulator / antitoxin HipB